jgi:hypothetical protein
MCTRVCSQRHADGTHSQLHFSALPHAPAQRKWEHHVRQSSHHNCKALHTPKPAKIAMHLSCQGPVERPPCLHLAFMSHRAPAMRASGTSLGTAPGGAAGRAPLLGLEVLERSSRSWHVLIRTRCAVMTCAAAQAQQNAAPAEPKAVVWAGSAQLCPLSCTGKDVRVGRDMAHSTFHHMLCAHTPGFSSHVMGFAGAGALLLQAPCSETHVRQQTLSCCFNT